MSSRLYSIDTCRVQLLMVLMLHFMSVCRISFHCMQCALDDVSDVLLHINTPCCTVSGAFGIGSQILHRWFPAYLSHCLSTINSHGWECYISRINVYVKDLVPLLRLHAGKW